MAACVTLFLDPSLSRPRLSAGDPSFERGVLKPVRMFKQCCGSIIRVQDVLFPTRMIATMDLWVLDEEALIGTFLLNCSAGCDRCSRENGL